ncbi:MAG: response regulator transcription factor [Acidobacteria bacterium]|nr:response regulator transcription factor [Acidobacteriota bacterium]
MVENETKVLIVDDEPEITRSMSDYLVDLGYHVITLNSAIDVLETVSSENPDIIILDIILPGTDGLTLCRHIRQLPNYYPVILLTSKSDIIDKVVGLEMGADDYVTKPFSLREVEARIKSVLRRQFLAQKGQQRSTTGNLLQFDELSLDIQNHMFKVGENRVDLTPKEFELMKLFMSFPGRAFSRDELLERIWGEDYRGYHRTIDSHINRLRLKIENIADHPKIIMTVWGVGYKLNETFWSNK